MIISEINPFIRFAQKIVLTESTPEVSTYDNRLFYLLDGECTVCIEKEEKKIKTGSILLWKSGAVYRFLIENKVKLIAINFDYTQNFKNKKAFFPPVESEMFDKSDILENHRFSDSVQLNSPIILNQLYGIYPYLERIIQEHQKNILFSDEYCSAVLKEVILEIIRSAVFPSAAAYNRMDKVIEYIEENYSQDISNQDLAKIAGYHPYHMNRLMRDYTQSTVHQYLINYRLKKSQALLTNTSLGITEISELCGFKSAYYFSNLFKKKFKIAPTGYRKSQKNKA